VKLYSSGCKEMDTAIEWLKLDSLLELHEWSPHTEAYKQPLESHAEVGQ